MGKGQRFLRSFRAGDDYSHLLSLLEDGEEFVNIYLADLSQKPEAEAAPDYRGSSQRALFILIEPLQATTDDQANVFRNVDFVDLDVFAELAGCIEDFPLFDQMSVHLLDEERVSLTLLEDKAHQTLGNLAL